MLRLGRAVTLAGAGNTPSAADAVRNMRASRIAGGGAPPPEGMTVPGEDSGLGFYDAIPSVLTAKMLPTKFTTLRKLPTFRNCA